LEDHLATHCLHRRSSCGLRHCLFEKLSTLRPLNLHTLQERSILGMEIFKYFWGSQGMKNESVCWDCYGVYRGHLY
jgi:hypothetical protein